MKQRMRRISALLLVVLMCVGSIVPAFAATSATCPGKDADGKTIPHTLANCSGATKVKDVPAVCGEQGYTIYECPTCGEFFADNFVDSLGDHDYALIYKAATCTEDAYVQYICYNCGDDMDPYGDGKDYETGVQGPDDENGTEPGLGHDWTVPADGVLNSCTDEATCERCGEAWSDGNHNWGEPEITTEPTHSANGKAKYTCEDCGKSKTVTVTKQKVSGVTDGHDWIYFAQLDPTCTEPGVGEGWRCSICGLTCADSDTANTKTPNGLGTKNGGFAAITKLADHQYGEIENGNYPEWWTVTENSCTTAGSYVKICKVCGEQGTAVNLPATGHSYQYKIYRVATTAEVLAKTAEKFEVTTPATAIWVITKDADGKYGDPVLTTITDANKGNYTWTGEFKDVRTSYELGDCGTRYGYDYYSCAYCHQTKTVTHVPEHIWELDEAASDAPSCTAEYTLVYKCVRPNCNGKIEGKDSAHVTNSTTTPVYAIKTEIKAQTGHNIAEKTVPADCQNEGYTTTRCWNEWCDMDAATAGNQPYVETNKDRYNVVPADPTNGHKIVEVSRTDATCTAEGEVVYECEVEGCTKAPDYVVLQKIPHEIDPDTNPSYKYATSCTEKSTVTYTCKYCRKGITQDVAARYSSHSYYEVTADNIAKGYVQVKQPTCAASGTDGYYIVKCKNLTAANDPAKPCTHTQKTGKIEFVKSNVDHHVAPVKGALDTPSKYCTEGDLYNYTCTCGSFKAIDPDSIENTKHDLETIEAKPETCISNGYTTYKACKRIVNTKTGTARCAHTEGYEIVNKIPDATKHTGNIVRAEAVAPTCSTFGWNAGYKCDACDWYVDFTTAGSGATPTFNLADDWTMAEARVAKLRHTTATVQKGTHTVVANGNNPDVGAQGCETFAYNHTICTLCGAEELTGYRGDLGGHNEKVVLGDDPTCAVNGWTAGVKCITHQIVKIGGANGATANATAYTACDCKYTGTDRTTDADSIITVWDELDANEDGAWVEEPEKIAEIAHKDADGEFYHVVGLNVTGSALAENVRISATDKFYAPCNAGATRNRLCLECNKTVYKPDAGLTETLLDDGHDWAITNYPATCQAYSYVLLVCKNDGCTASMMVTDGATYGEHVWGRWTISVYPTDIATGLSVRACTVAGCKATEEIVLPALSNLKFYFETDNGVVADAPVTNAGILALTIGTNANDLQVWGLRLQLSYNAKALKLLPEKTVVHNEALTTKVNENVKNGEGVATILAVAPVVDGTTSDITLNKKQEFVTLYFQVASEYTGEVEFTLTKAEVADKGQNYINILLDEEDSVMGDWIYGLGDVNLDGAYTVTDAKDMVLFITGESANAYSAFADIDQDGEITLADFAALEEFLLGKITYKQMVEGVRAANLA